MDSYKAAAVQFEVKPGDKKSNLTKAEKLLDKIAAEDVKLATFPEYCWTGYPAAEFAEPVPGGMTSELLSRKAKEHGMHIVTGSIIEKESGKLYLTNALINDKGRIVGKQRKIAILSGKWTSASIEWYPAMKDDAAAGIRPGESIEPFKTDLGSIGMLFGADMDVPEHARALTDKGAEILVASVSIETKFWADEIEFWSRCRAWENTCYLILADRVGTWKNSPSGDLRFAGYSLIVSPYSEVISSGSKFLEESVIATIDIKRLREIRKFHYLPSLRDANPKAYSFSK